MREKTHCKLFLLKLCASLVLMLRRPSRVAVSEPATGEEVPQCQQHPDNHTTAGLLSRPLRATPPRPSSPFQEPHTRPRNLNTQTKPTVNQVAGRHLPSRGLWVQSPSVFKSILFLHSDALKGWLPPSTLTSRHTANPVVILAGWAAPGGASRAKVTEFSPGD